MISDSTTRSDTVWFTTKGQVVIPLRLRKEFHIEDGTRAVVEVWCEKADGTKTIVGTASALEL